MPKWGLTEDMIDAGPWGFTRDGGLLARGKVITDPVHGDIYLNKLEMLIVDSPPLQRLRRVRQLGMTPEVYPGSTNTRFSHSLGAVRAAQDLLDIILDQRLDPHGVEADLFAEWEAKGDKPKDFPQVVGEVVVAARLGALLHDLAHVPFGHSIEDDLGIFPAHDEGPDRFEYLWGQLTDYLLSHVEGDASKEIEVLTAADGPLAKEVRPLILSKEEVETEGAPGDRAPVEAHKVMKYPFVADLVGNTICADLIDYLPRDHLYSGLPMALGHRFLDAFFVTPTDRTRYERRMALSISRSDRERTDIITELLKYLRYRYELTERVLVHHAKLASDAMVGKALELWFEELQDEYRAEDEADGARKPDEVAVAAGKQGANGQTGASPAPAEDKPATEDKPAAKGEPAAEEPEQPVGPLDDSPADDPKTRARKHAERRILKHGDDGLLEHLRDWSEARANDKGASPRLDALSALVEGLLDRDLFSLAGRSSEQQAAASDIYEAHRRAPDRRKLEKDAADFAGIEEAWKVCIWLPPPSPRLKSAEVLVFDGSEIVPFHKSEASKRNRGQDIYDAHHLLWAVSVYIHRSVDDETARHVLVRLAQRMEVRWDSEVGELGYNVLQWPDLLAAKDVCKSEGLPGKEGDLLDRATLDKVARGPGDVATYAALRKAYEAVAKELKKK